MGNALVGQTWHPADANQDNHILLDEIGPYHASISNPSDLFWQQAQFIWTEGGRYESIDALAEPYRWLPPANGTEQYVSLDKRRAHPFDPIQVLGLPDGASMTAEFKVEGATAWIALESIENAPSNTYGFHMPYIPSPWLGCV